MEKASSTNLSNTTFLNFFNAHDSPAEQCLGPIQNNRVEHLHAMLTPVMLTPKDNQQPLLLHAAFHNSPVSALYLLRRGTRLDASDVEQKTVFHVCAYTGHIEVLKAVRNEMKLTVIKSIHQEYTALLIKNNYKRTDAKAGKLKTSASEARKAIFKHMQQGITETYEKHVKALVLETIRLFSSLVKDTNRNCFHLASLNRYQRCFNTMEYMFQELGDINLHLDGQKLDYYTQVNACFHREQERIDPRSYEDTLALVEEFILPAKLEEIKKGILKVVEAEKENILAEKDKDGRTPLYIASKDGCTAIINLIRKQQTCKTKQGEDKEDLIKIACHNLARSHIMDLCDASKVSDSKTMNFLLSCGEEVNKKKTIFGTFALLESIKCFQKSKNIDPVQMLILSGADINEQDTNGWTVLHHACEKGSRQVLEEIFRIWLEGKTKKILINRLTNKNYHILHLAAINNHPQIIEFLLTSPAAKKLELNASAVDGDHCTMLHHAARKGAIEALKRILELSPGLIYEKDVRDNTALHYAAMSDHIACVKYLLYFDSDYDKLTRMQNTKGKLAKDLTLQKRTFENVFSSARAGDVNQVRKLIGETPALKSQETPSKHRTLLILAVMNQHLLVVKFLIQLGADQSQKDTSGKAARDYANQNLKSSKTKQAQVLAKNIAALFSP